LEYVELTCWFCGEPVEIARIESHGTLAPRDPERGGPFYRLRCEGCGRPILCERNDTGAYLCSPPEITPFVDVFFACFDRDLALDLDRKREWFDENAGLRDRFFASLVEPLFPGPKEGERRANRADGQKRARRPDRGERARPGEPVEAFDPYKVLGLREGATREEFIKAFRELAKKYHPDRFAHLDGEFQALAHRKFLRLRRAYDALLDGKNETEQE
jgi:hypothetical protein